MRKTYIIALAASLLMQLPLSSEAQVLLPERIDITRPVQLSEPRVPSDVKVRPLRTAGFMPSGNRTAIPTQFKSHNAIPAMRPISPMANAGAVNRVPTNAPELYVNMVASDGWKEGSEGYGVYSMIAKSPVYFNQLASNGYASYYGTGNAGGAIVDGIYYVADMSDPWGTGSYTCNILAFDLSTGSVDFTNTKMYVGMSLCGTDWAQDGPGGDIYGQFYNSDGTALEFGKLDLDNQERTTISTCQRHYVALGIASDGFMYGVSNDGNLYKINKTTGEETLVGSTGVTVSNGNGVYYYQTGEIDPSTDTFYWASVDADGHSALRTVDLKTGHATKVADFDDDEFLTGMVLPSVGNESGAPARPSNLDVNFNGTSLTGTVSFQAPDKTVGGDTLTGTVNCVLKVDDDVVDTLTANAGASATASVTVTSAGLHTFEVYATNAAGNGPSLKNVVYLGQDVPRIVDTATAVLVDTNAVKITWSKFSEGKHHGPLGDVHYDVVRYPEGKIVATNLTDTTFTDTAIPVDQMQSMYYGIRMTGSTDIESEEKSNRILVGYAYRTPYKADFSTTDLMKDYFTVIDVNNDYRETPMGTYETLYSGGWAQSDGLATYYSSYWNDADDWLITPPVRLESEKIYSLTFHAGGEYAQNERMEVKYGTANTVGGMTETIMEPTDISTSTLQEHTLLVKPAADGRYYFGFHALSKANKGWLSIKDISVSAFDAKAPGAPAVTSMKAAVRGAHKMTISVKAPQVCVDSTTLSQIDYLTVTLNNATTDTVRNVAPGKEVSVTMDFTTDGYQTVSVVAHNAAGNGLPANDQAWGGLDIPVAPSNVTLSDKGKNLLATWDVVPDTGQHGGYVDPSTVGYKVYKINQTYYGTYPTLVDSLGNVVEDTINTDPTTGTQDLVRYGVSAYNTVGEGDKATSNGVVIGKPYDLPVVESAPHTNTSYFWWLTNEGTKNWGLNTSVSADNDGCCFAYVPANAGEKAWLNSGKISFHGATNPAIVLYCASGSATSGNKIIAEVQYPDGRVVSADTINMTMRSWTREVLNLPVDIANEDYVIVRFLGDASDANFMVIDDIEIRDLKPNDLQAAFTTTTDLVKGQPSTVRVRVSNEGRNAADSYTVSLSLNGRRVSQQQSESALRMLTDAFYDFKITPSVFLDADSADLVATVDYSADTYTDNNSAKKAVALADSKLPVPQEVTSYNAGGKGNVAWHKPQTENVRVTDDFESYTPWTTSISNWTMVDGDKGLTNPLWSNMTIPNQYTPFAFEVFNFSNLGGNTDINPMFKSHSGNQHLAAIYSRLNNRGVDQDNWLVSSQLSGMAQTISFYCRNLTAQGTDYPEHINILASSTTADTTAFTVVADTTISGGEWQEVTVALPEGTKYFAIQHNTGAQGAFVFFLDDITYERSYSDPDSYNIYRDGELIGSVNGKDALAFVDSNATAAPTYYVSAVYADGESMPVKAEISTSINQVVSTLSGPFDVYTTSGAIVARNVSTMAGLKSAVYILKSAGKAVKVIVK